MPIVVDASVVAAWAFRDETNEQAKEFLFKVRNQGAVAPVLLRYEIHNTLVIAERRGRIEPGDTEDFLSGMEKLPIEIEVSEFRSVVRLARLHQLSAYDAAYLEVAIRRNLPLVTFDRKLAQAAKLESLTVYPE